MRIARFLAVLAALIFTTSAILWVGRGLMPRELSVNDSRRGREVFYGRGLCSGCHALGGSGGGYRGPNLDDLGGHAGSRVEGLDAVGYVVQSLYRPDAHVVEGYPEGLMPTAHLPPIALSRDDITAVVALVLEGAREDTYTPQLVSSIRGEQDLYDRGQRVAHAAEPGDPERGRALWTAMSCRKCHALGGVTTAADDRESAGFGPDLTGIGRYQSAAYLRQSIVEPNAVVVPGDSGEYYADDGRHSRMPSYAEVMTDADVDDLVRFLRTVDGAV